MFKPSRKDMENIFHYVGIVLIALGLSMFIPLVISMVAGEWSAVLEFVISAGITVGVGNILYFGLHPQGRVTWNQGLLLEAGELRGGNSGMAVWLPAVEAEKIKMLGRYGTKGDFVEVRGVFNATCLEHGGDFDIHAHTLEVIDGGEMVDTSPDIDKYYGAVLAGAFAIATLVPFWRHRTRKKESERASSRKRKQRI